MAQDTRPHGPLSSTVQWATTIGALAILVSIGIWVGTIQAQLNQVVCDANGNEKVIVAHSKLFQEAETRERDRLEGLLRAVREQFNADKDDLLDLAHGIDSVRMEIRYRHGEWATPHAGRSVERQPLAAAPARTVRPTKADVSRVSKAADKAVDAADDAAVPTQPLKNFSF